MLSSYHFHFLVNIYTPKLAKKEEEEEDNYNICDGVRSVKIYLGNPAERIAMRQKDVSNSSDEIIKTSGGYSFSQMNTPRLKNIPVMKIHPETNRSD